jgi:hypothetical protein
LTATWRRPHEPHGDTDRDEVARILEQIVAEARDGETTFSNSTPRSTPSPRRSCRTDQRYFEAHITCEPIEEFRRIHGVMQPMTDWRVSKFEHDDVDEITGKWFLSSRHASYSAHAEAGGHVGKLSGSRRTLSCGTRSRRRCSTASWETRCEQVSRTALLRRRAGEEQKKRTDEAHRLMTERFGIGALDAWRVLETDAGAKRIYDCAIAVIA